MTIPRDLSNLAPGANTSGVLQPTKGGTGATTLTGYVKGSGTSAFTASSTVPTSDLTGTLGVSNGGTGAANLTANNVLLGNGTSAVQFVAPGTSGNILTSNGTTWASTAPTSSSAIVFLQSVTASNVATVALDTTIDSTYDVYMITAEDIRPVSDSVNLLIEMRVSGNYTTGSYKSIYSTNTSAAGNNGFASVQANPGRLTTAFLGSDSTASANFVGYLYNPSSTSVYKHFNLTGSYVRSTTTYQFISSIVDVGQTGAVTGVRFSVSGGGNISAGTFRLYGIKNS